MDKNNSLWVWKSSKGYWNSDREKFVKNKNEATFYPWWKASICVTIGDGEWIDLKTQKMTKIINGTAIASEIRLEIKQKIIEIGKNPTLAIITTNDDPASEIYVNHKIKACLEVGINVVEKKALSKNHLIEIIKDLNKDDFIDAYILQLPLPNGWNPCEFFNLFDPRKDVDVFHPENVGLLVQGNPRFKPCTPHGIQIMLHKSGIKVLGKKIVIINRSNVVGKPLSSMLIQECDDYANATVTVCHDKTPPKLLKKITKTADIIIVAVGKPNFLTEDMVKKNAVVVDVGISRLDGKIVGDVDFENVKNKASAITPVPGGVGPMTVAMLLNNVLVAFLNKN